MITLPPLTLEILLALIAFAFVSSITPGPNNLMLLASGVNFGFQRTLPHMMGVCLGFTLMVFLVGVGLMQVFELYPLSQQILKVLSVGYLVYLAGKIATAAPLSKRPDHETAQGKPMTFMQAVLFQWVNPKAWTMALTAITIYSPQRELSMVLVVALVFGLVNLPSISMWTILGGQLRALLRNDRALRIFNVSMALLLLLSLYPILFMGV